MQRNCLSWSVIWLAFFFFKLDQWCPVMQFLTDFHFHFRLKLCFPCASGCLQKLQLNFRIFLIQCKRSIEVKKKAVKLKYLTLEQVKTMMQSICQKKWYPIQCYTFQYLLWRFSMMHKNDVVTRTQMYNV